MSELNLAKDFDYKPLWRARSVSDLASEEKDDKKKRGKTKHGKSGEGGGEEGRRSKSGGGGGGGRSKFQTYPQIRPSSSGRARSSLTANQVRKRKLFHHAGMWFYLFPV